MSLKIIREDKISLLEENTINFLILFCSSCCHTIILFLLPNYLNIKAHLSNHYILYIYICPLLCLWNLNVSNLWFLSIALFNGEFSSQQVMWLRYHVRPLRTTVIRYSSFFKALSQQMSEGLEGKRTRSRWREQIQWRETSGPRIEPKTNCIKTRNINHYTLTWAFISSPPWQTT